MALITVDEKKCKKDGICASECPFVLISQKDPESLPEAVPNAEKLCIRCGHCVAVCPHGALSLAGMDEADYPFIQKGLKLSPEQAEQFLRSRRSIRLYKDRPAPREVLQKLVELARYAPTAHNDQEVRWLVIEDKVQVQRLAGVIVDWLRSVVASDPAAAKKMHLDLILGAWDFGMDVITRNAPHLVINFAPKKSPFAELYPLDCAMALAYLELAAPVFGMGSCWNGMLLFAASQSQAVREALGIAPEYQICGALMLGYPKYKYTRLAGRKPPQITWGLNGG
ncbi:MAG: nitroreductase family protein [Thermodesulfobacteriota bacterium]